jgi:cytochrome c oxidase assembly protein subunit 15
VRPADGPGRGYDAAVDRLTRFAWVVLGYNILVILWGAVVRATGSGAGCGSHWPLCNGEVVPRAQATATLIEFSHRLTSGVALLLVLALLVWVFRVRPRGHPTRGAALWAMVFMLGEAAVGAMLVLFELVAENRSLARGLFMAMHLVNTFFLLGALALTAHFAGGGPPQRLRGRTREATLLALAAFLVLLSSASGAVAALGDTLFPSQTLAEAMRADLSATSHLLVRLRVLHPFVAVATAALLVALSIAAGRFAFDRSVKRLARTLAGLAVMQTALGAVNVLLLAPVVLQLLHLLLADVVWIVFVLLAATRLQAEAVAHPAASEAPDVTLPVGARAR